jgi:2-dehydropantoate 2-reductase
MRIGIVGAGAIGGWLGVSLAAAGHEVSALARGATLAALQERPWTLLSEDRNLAANVKASADATALGPQDVIFLTVKGPALPSLASAIATMIGPDTLVVPAMNGVPWWYLRDAAQPDLRRPLATVDPGGLLSRSIPFEQVVGAVVYTSAATLQPGEVMLKTGNRLMLGEPSGEESQRVTRLVEALQAAGIEAAQTGRIQYEIWYKLWGNMTINPISALTGATSDRILDDPLVAEFVLAIMAEAKQVGRGIGIDIEERGEDRNLVTRSWGAFKTSMLQDTEAGRSLELDQIVAAPREIAIRLGIVTPALDALLGLTRLFARQRGLYPSAANAADAGTAAPPSTTGAA